MLHWRDGGSMQGGKGWGEVHLGRETETHTHKRTRDISSTEDNSNFLQNPQTKNNAPKNRQPHSPVIHHKNGRKEQPEDKRNQQTNMGIHDEKQMSVDSRIHTIQAEYRGRPRIQSKRLQRMEIEPSNLSNNMQQNGQTRNRSICIPGNTSADQIYVMETRPKGNSSKCTTNKLDTYIPICIPTIQTNWEDTQQNKIPPHLSDHCYSTVAKCTMVSNVNPNGNKRPTIPTNNTNITHRPNGNTTPTTSSRETKTSGMACLRTRLQNKGIPIKATELLLKARTRGTTRAYESAWVQYASWCDQQQKDPIHCDINSILEYLTMTWEQGKEYRTINNYRSAISLYHEQIEGFKVGQHPLITQLLKGISKDRPPKPKLNTVWDVDTVITYLKQLPTNTENTIKSLTLKTITLIALVAIPRAKELHNLDLKWMIKKQNHIEFQIEGTVKHSRQGKQNPPIIIHRFEEDTSICPVQTVVDYLKITEPWRQTAEQSKLFLTTIKPHSPATKTTISNWIKQTLKLAGIDTQQFTAHSTRSAAASKAESRSLPREIILARGNWKNKSTFERFYNRKVYTKEKTFQSSVLK